MSRLPLILSAASAFAFAVAPVSARADDPFKIEVLKEAPPAGLSAAVKAELKTEGFRVMKEGKPFADFWFRKGTPASAKPGAPNGNILFPVIKEGELMGALKYASEGQDYRDQAIATGVYTMRYGIQPVNGAHLGVSPFRDFILLLPAAKDAAVEIPTKKSLEDKSSEAAGTSHPACLMLLSAPAPVKGAPSMVHDDTKDTWGAVVSAPLAVKGSTDAVPLDLQLVVSGAAAP